METDTSMQEIREGERLFQMGNIEKALFVFESIAEKQPDNLSALNNKAVSLNGLARYDEAVEIFLDILEKDGNNSTAAFNLISVYLALKDLQGIEKAISAYAHCLSQEDILLITDDLRKWQAEEKNVPEIDKRDPSLSGYAQTHKDILKTLKKNLFFIMGVPKSGTTWMQYLLNGHPEIACSGEGNYNHIIKGLKNIVNDYNLDISGVNRAIGTTDFLLFSRENLQYLFVTSVGLLLNNLQAGPEIKCIGSKNPILIKELEVHADLLPSSKFIHIIREGRDVIVSAWFNNLRGNEEDTRRRWPDFKTFVDFGARQWVSDITKARLFGKAYPGRYLELRYEDLHENP